MNAYQEYLRDHGTPEELRAILGPNWAICRKTPSNISRYGRCITRREYDQANRAAIELRLVRATDRRG